MLPAFVVRFSPTGPWRIGPDSGERDRVETVLHSDALYSAITASMAQLGLLEEWLRAMFENPEGPPVRFSSCFPFLKDARFVVPPNGLWPPPPSLKIRWKGARLIPLLVVEDLLAGRPLDEEAWRLDGWSRCLVPSGWPAGPFRPVIRSSAAIDRVFGNHVTHKTACLEFTPEAGMWAIAVFSGIDAKERWAESVRACLRLLADSGLGGERSRGWGRSLEPQFEEGEFPDLVGSRMAPISDNGTPGQPEVAHWLLSLFSPAETDNVDWTRGHYSALTRAGRVQSPRAAGELKRKSRMIAEGSVILSQAPPIGSAGDVAPPGLPHPVYRAGFALSVAIPYRGVQR